MPIRINLLAEAQAAEEMRRKDPVKRGLWVAGFLVLVFALWIVKIQFDIKFKRDAYSARNNEWNQQLGKFQGVTNNEVRTAQIDYKINELDPSHHQPLPLG